MSTREVAKRVWAALRANATDIVFSVGWTLVGGALGAGTGLLMAAMYLRSR